MFSKWRHALTAIAVLACASAHLPAQEFDEEADDRVRRVVKILRTSNKAQVNQFVPVVVEFKHVNPYAVARYIRRPIEAEEGNWWTFVHPDGNSGRLLINVPSWQVEPMKELVALLDRPELTSSSGYEREYIPLRHRDPGDSGFREAILANMTGAGKAVADRGTGSLFIQDAPSGLVAALEAIANDLDRPTKQVQLRVKVYELDVSNDATLGLDYTSWKNGPGRNLFAAGVFSDYYDHSGDDPGIIGGGLPTQRIHRDGSNFAYMYDVPSAFFDFLVVKGKARVLTEPKVVVRNTETAVFRAGEDILYYLVQTGDNDLAGLRPDGLVLDQYNRDSDYPDNRTGVKSIIEGSVEPGIDMSVTPIIGEEDICLDVSISYVSHLGFDDRGIPMIQERDVETELRVAPGAEYIIGGLTRIRAIQGTSKVPILGSIPGLGWLFGGETTAAKRTQAVIVVSAVEVDDYSGLEAKERAAIDAVETTGMDQIETPAPLYGFDMMLMDNTSAN